MTVASARIARRWRIYERDGGICGICGLPVPFDAMHIDHIIPTSRGGSDDESNLQPSHVSCNCRAGDKRPRKSTGRSKSFTSLNLTQEELDNLRGLAEDLHMFHSRGPSAGRFGSISAVIAALARSYRHNPEATRLAMSEMIAELPPPSPAP